MKPKKNRLEYETIRKMTDEELNVEVTNQRGKHFTLRSQMVTEKVEDHSQFREHRKNVARLLTEQSARGKAKSGASK
jgi:ribosomal protein L29